jgi:hypothetical protein
MAKSIEQYITEANARLKAGKTGMVIELRFNKLCLRGQLPPRPGSVKVEAYSQRVPLKYLGNPAGIAQAEADAFLVAGQLIKEKFRCMIGSKFTRHRLPRLARSWTS